jgi:hypothetical protein
LSLKTHGSQSEEDAKSLMKAPTEARKNAKIRKSASFE